MDELGPIRIRPIFDRAAREHGREDLVGRGSRKTQPYYQGAGWCDAQDEGESNERAKPLRCDVIQPDRATHQTNGSARVAA
jgi:hypothetical protein